MSATPGPGPFARALARVDALSLRERLLAFGVAAIVLVALADFAVLTPEFRAQRKAAAALEAQRTELQALQQRVAALPSAAASSPAGRLRAELDAVRAETAAAEAEISAAGQVPVPRLEDLVERVLQRHGSLRLERLATGRPAAALPGLPPMQGVEFALQGRYPELTRYVEDLERQLPGLRWDELTLRRRDDGTELVARLALPGDPR